MNACMNAWCRMGGWWIAPLGGTLVPRLRAIDGNPATTDSLLKEETT